MEISTERERCSNRIHQPLERISAEDHLLTQRGNRQHQQIEEKQEPLVRSGPQRDAQAADEYGGNDGQQQQSPANG